MENRKVRAMTAKEFGAVASARSSRRLRLFAGHPPCPAGETGSSSCAVSASLVACSRVSRGELWKHPL